MISARCYGGPADGERIAFERGQDVRVVQMPHLVWQSMGEHDVVTPVPFMYSPMWVTAPGWRIYFPILVPNGWLLGGTPAGTVMPGHIEGQVLEHWPIEEGMRLR